MIEIEPVNMAFETECQHLTGKKRRGEHILEWVDRGLRIRALLRAEATLNRVRAEIEGAA